METEFEKSVKESLVALSYASEKGLLTDSDEKGITEVVTLTKHNLPNVAPDLEVKFWTAYSKLAKKIQPATVESILSIEDTEKGNSPWNKIFPRLSDARKSIRFYQRLGFASMLVMLIFQIYWIIGAGFVSDIKNLPDVREKLFIEKKAREEILGEKAALDLQIKIMESKIISIEGQLESCDEGLKKWYTPFKFLLYDTSFDTNSNTGAAKYRMSRYATFILEVIQSYVLPILYGLLGAFAFVLRKLSREVNEKSFSRESRVNYLLRIHLGALAGLSIGWFFGNTMHAAVNISSLSPLALAFLAGYSVDLLFSSMDRIIDSISAKSSQSAQQNSMVTTPSK